MKLIHSCIVFCRSEDGTARLLLINENESNTPIILEHKPKEQQDIAPNSFDVSTLEWNVSYHYCTTGVLSLESHTHILQNPSTVQINSAICIEFK